MFPTPLLHKIISYSPSKKAFNKNYRCDICAHAETESVDVVRYHWRWKYTIAAWVDWTVNSHHTTKTRYIALRWWWDRSQAEWWRVQVYGNVVDGELQTLTTTLRRLVL